MFTLHARIFALKIEIDFRDPIQLLKKHVTLTPWTLGP